MKVYQIATIGDGNTKVWFSKNAITNIFSLQMVRQHYPINYNCKCGQFVVDRVEYRKPNMIFQMHPSGLHI